MKWNFVVMVLKWMEVIQMSKEYIEREAIIQKIKEAKNNFSPTVRPIFDVATHLISHAPAADVAPVVHGEWIHKNGEIYCSVCGGEALMDEVYYKSPYCPDCGARMDGGNSNGTM